MEDERFEGPLAEFNSLRSEIDSRAKFQQQILALQLTLTSTVIGFVLSRQQLEGLLLIVPLSSYLLCGRYVAQRNAIQAASRYISQELSPRVPGGFGWVIWSLENRRSGRLLGWGLPMTLAFPGVSALALLWTYHPMLVDNSGHWPLVLGLSAVWYMGALATLISTYLLLSVLFDRPSPIQNSRAMSTITKLARQQDASVLDSPTGKDVARSANDHEANVNTGDLRS